MVQLPLFQRCSLYGACSISHRPIGTLHRRLKCFFSKQLRIATSAPSISAPVFMKLAAPNSMFGS